MGLDLDLGDGGDVDDCRGYPFQHRRQTGQGPPIRRERQGSLGQRYWCQYRNERAEGNQLLEHGEVRRGLLGVAVQDLTPKLARALGVGNADGALVSRVDPGSAAAAAGLRPGDLIVAVNGRPVTGAGALRAYIGLLRVGTPLALELIRKGARIRLESAVGDPYAGYVDGKRLALVLEGARLGDLIQGGGRDHRSAVAVGTVTKDSPAWFTGLREGDLLLEINQERVHNLKELRRILRRTRALVSLGIRRGDRIIVLRRR